MEFEEKQYDGPYEVSAIELDIEGQLLRGLLYFPREYYIKPYKLIIYFHDFPQLFSLHQIINSLEFLLDLGFSLLVFNFRGYRNSQGEVSIHSQLQDALELTRFIRLMVESGIFKQQDINIIAHGFGCYLSLLLCSMRNIFNKVLLISPILNLKQRINDEKFVKTLEYLNRYLLGYVHGIENISEFLARTKLELKENELQITNLLIKMKYNDMKIILGSKDKLINISELKSILHKLPKLEIASIEDMDHDWVEEKNLSTFQEEIISFFIS